MPYPTKYTRQFDFASYQNSNPTKPLPGDRVNFDLNAVKQSNAEIIDFLKGFTRSDGKLANGSVGVNQLDATFDLGFSLPTTWAPHVDYTIDSTVLYANRFYKANVAHTSTDGFDESKWDLIVDFGEQADAAAASAVSASSSASAAAASASAATTQAGNASDSATAASNSATAASGSATTATTAAGAASDSATAAAASATSAAASFDSLDDRYLGAKSANPTVDNDGDPLAVGALYWNTTSQELCVWTGSAWLVVGTGMAVSTYDPQNVAGDIFARVELPSRAFAQTMFSPVTAPDFIRTAGYYAAADGGAVLYKKNGGTTGDMVVTLHDGVTQVGYNVADIIINSKMFGAKWDGVTDDTAAVQKAMNDARHVLEPVGTSLISTVLVPDGYGKVFVGSGDSTIFLQKGNAALFKKSTAGGVMQGGDFGYFAVKPLAAGSAFAAIYLSGFRHSAWRRVTGLDNGTGGFRALFNVAASPYLCYGCLIENASVSNKAGYLYGIEFDNGGTNNPSYNANTTTILNPWIISNADMLRAIDCRRSTGTKIFGGLCEQNTIAVGVDCGSGTLVEGLWQEVQSYNWRFEVGTDGGYGNDCLITKCIGTSDALFVNNPHGNVFFLNLDNSTGTWTGNTKGANVWIGVDPSFTSSPAAPGVAYDSGEGVAGNLSLVNATVIKPFDQITRRVVYRYYYTFTPGTATSYTKFKPAALTGFTVVDMNVGANDSALMPTPSCINWSDTSFIVKNSSTSERISFTVEYIRNYLGPTGS